MFPSAFFFFYPFSKAIIQFFFNVHSTNKFMSEFKWRAVGLDNQFFSLSVWFHIFIFCKVCFELYVYMVLFEYSFDFILVVYSCYFIWFWKCILRKSVWIYVLNYCFDDQFYLWYILWRLFYISIQRKTTYIFFF